MIADKRLYRDLMASSGWTSHLRAPPHLLYELICHITAAGYQSFPKRCQAALADILDAGVAPSRPCRQKSLHHLQAGASARPISNAVHLLTNTFRALACCCYCWHEPALLLVLMHSTQVTAPMLSVVHLKERIILAAL